MSKTQCTCFFGKNFCNSVYTAYCRYYPNVVAYTDVSVLPHEGGNRKRGKRFKFRYFGCVCIVKCTAEDGFQVVAVHLFSDLDIVGCNADGKTVLDDLFSFFYFFDGVFVTVRKGDFNVVFLVDYNILH